MTNLSGKTASGLSGESRLLKGGAIGGRWSDVTLGITWKEARRPVFKTSQSDDGRRRLLTVERLYQGAPASNSKIIRAGDKLISIDTEGSSRSTIGNGVNEIVKMMERVGEKQDIKLEFLRAADTLPFTHTKADKFANRNCNTYTISLSANPTKIDSSRNVEQPRQKSNRPGSRSGRTGKCPGTKETRPSSRSGPASPHAPRPPSTGSSSRPTSRPGTQLMRPKTTSWTISDDPEDPRSARPVNASRFERLIFAVNKRLKDASLLQLLSVSYLIDRPRTPDDQGRNIMVGSPALSLRACYRLQRWWSPEQQAQVKNMSIQLRSRGDADRLRDVLDMVDDHTQLAAQQYANDVVKREAERNRAASRIQGVHRGNTMRARIGGGAGHDAESELLESPSSIISPSSGDGQHLPFTQKPTVVTWVNQSSPCTSPRGGPRGQEDEMSAAARNKYLPSVVSWSTSPMVSRLLPKDAKEEEALLMQLAQGANLLVDDVLQQVVEGIEGVGCEILEMFRELGLESFEQAATAPLKDDVVLAISDKFPHYTRDDVEAMVGRMAANLALGTEMVDSVLNSACLGMQALQAGSTDGGCGGDDEAVAHTDAFRRAPLALQGDSADATGAAPTVTRKPSVVSWVSSPLSPARRDRIGERMGHREDATVEGEIGY